MVVRILLVVIVLPWANGFIDVRHRFGLPHMPVELKKQILIECNATFTRFFKERRRKVHADAKEDDYHCPVEVENCILMKTNPFMEHCSVTCTMAAGKLSNDLSCWNDNCFTRATRICEEKFWRTVSVAARKKKKKKMRCITEIKHCYKLACMKCLGRECDMNCYGGGVQYTRLTKPHWKGYGEYKKFFPEVTQIPHQYVIVPEKGATATDYYE